MLGALAVWKRAGSGEPRVITRKACVNMGRARMREGGAATLLVLRCVSARTSVSVSETVPPIYPKPLNDSGLVLRYR